MKYKFNKAIGDQLRPFKNWLKKEGYARESIRIKSRHAGHFLKWLEKERLSPQNTRYNDMLNYIDYCKTEGESNGLVNNKLTSTRNYYAYLKKQGQCATNPASNLYLKGERHKIPSNLIGYLELEKLYHTYKTETLRQKRNKAILGLLVYQGTTSGELQKLETEHIKLKEGKIHVPGSRKSNGRYLELKPFQILELQEYINQTRPEIVARINRPKPNKKNQKAIEKQLFISTNGSKNLKSSLKHLFREIRRTMPEFLNPGQIRASTITYWLKNYNLRQVQYMAGHKYVSSTEYYRQDKLESLQAKLEKLHPLNNT